MKKERNAIKPPPNDSSLAWKCWQRCWIPLAFAAIAVSGQSVIAAPSTVPATNHLQLWLRSDTGVATNASGGVNSWADQSGKGNNAKQTDDTMAPSLVPNAINNLPAVRFNGNNNYLDVADAPSIEITGDISSFAVIRVDDFSNYRSVWGKTVSNLPGPTDWYLVSGTGVPLVYRGDGTSANLGNVTADRPVRAGTYLILGFVMGGTTLTHYLNGFAIGSGQITATIADGATALKIGSRDDLVTKMKGDLAELLIYDSALSDTDRNAIFDYLKNRYGLQNLPPTVSLTAPANNAHFAAPTNIVVTADASDPDGTVSKVDFMANGRIFATATAKPYSVPISLVSGGSITLTAVATDDKDAPSTSNPVQITVTSGAPPSYTPGSTLKLWLKADSGVTTNASGAVTGWKDQSGNTNNAAQTDPTQAPQLVANVVNGQPALQYDGTQKYLDVASSDTIAITNDITSFFVVEFDDFATYRSVWGKTSSNVPRPTDYYVLPGSGVPRLYRGNDSGQNAFVDGAGGFPTNQFLIAGFTHTGGVLTHWLNGGAFGSGTMTIPTSDDGTPLKVGSRDDFVTELKGNLSELLIYNAALAKTEQDSLTAYLAGKYGIPVFLNLNQAPSVNLTNPTTGLSFAAPTNLTLRATASDSDGSVVSVDFYANGVPVGTATNSPFVLPVSVLTPGAVSLSAVATDNLGLTSTSAPVSMTATGPVSTMTVTSGLQLWLKAGAGVSTNADGTVSTWADQSGKSNNATQPDSTIAPKLVPNAANGQAVVRFDGTTNYLVFATPSSLTITGNISSFFVIKCDDFANYRGIWSQTIGGHPAPNDYYLAAGSGVPTFYRGDGANQAGVSGQRAIPAGSYVVLGFDASGTNVNHYWNGQTNGTGVIDVAPGDGGLPVTLGSRDDFVTQMKGDIAELLIYNQTLSEADRASVAGYLASKYGIPFVRAATTLAAGPTLSISGQPSTGFVISWPASVTGFTLQSAGSLTNPTWTTVPNVQNNQVTVQATGSSQFYRLRQQ
jgi:hypothetical protein